MCKEWGMGGVEWKTSLKQLQAVDTQPRILRVALVNCNTFLVGLGPGRNPRGALLRVDTNSYAFMLSSTCRSPSFRWK